MDLLPPPTGTQGLPAPAPTDKEAKLGMPRSPRAGTSKEAREDLMEAFVSLQTLMAAAPLPAELRAVLDRYTAATQSLFAAMLPSA